MPTPKSILLTVLFVYVLLLMVCPNFGIVDDHQIATMTRVDNDPRFPLAINTQNGRFEPLDSQEYTVLGKLFTFTPQLCYAFNAAQLVVFILIAVLFSSSFMSLQWAYITTTLLLLSPGFVAAWFRLNVGDRGALFWLLACIASSERLGRYGSWGWLVVAAISGNLSMYYKEPAFAGLAIFSGLELVAALARRDASRKTLSHVILLCSTAVFLACYFLLIARHQTGHYADERRLISTVQNQIFSFRSNILVTNPLLFFVLVPDAFAAGVKAIRTRFVEVTTLDSLSIAGVSYILVISILNLPPNPYYLLPAYAFGLAPIGRRLSCTDWRAISTRTWILSALAVIGLCALPTTWITAVLEKQPIFALIAMTVFLSGTALSALLSDPARRICWSLSACLALLCVVGNQVPAAFNQLAFAKYTPWSFQHFLGELRLAVKSKKERPCELFVLGSPRAYALEAYVSIGEYLRLDFEVGRDFDLYSEIPAEKSFVPKPDSPYAVFRTATPTPVRPGSLLIGQNLSEAQFRSLSTSANLLFASSRPYWRYLPSLDSMIQRMKGTFKRASAKATTTEYPAVDFCLFVAK